MRGDEPDDPTAALGYSVNPPHVRGDEPHDVAAFAADDEAIRPTCVGMNR